MSIVKARARLLQLAKEKEASKRRLRVVGEEFKAGRHHLSHFNKFQAKWEAQDLKIQREMAELINMLRKTPSFTLMKQEGAKIVFPFWMRGSESKAHYLLQLFNHEDQALAFRARLEFKNILRKEAEHGL